MDNLIGCYVDKIQVDVSTIFHCGENFRWVIVICQSRQITPKWFVINGDGVYLCISVGFNTIASRIAFHNGIDDYWIIVVSMRDYACGIALRLLHELDGIFD